MHYVNSTWTPTPPTADMTPTLDALTRQLDKVIDAIIANPENTALLAVQQNLTDRIERIALSQKECKLAAEATQQNADVQTTFRMQSGNYASVEFAKVNAGMQINQTQTYWRTQTEFNQQEHITRRALFDTPAFQSLSGPA